MKTNLVVVCFYFLYYQLYILHQKKNEHKTLYEYISILIIITCKEIPE